MDKQLQHIKIDLTLRFKSTPQQVWQALTRDINAWWDKDLYTSPDTKRFILEARVGGRMYEDLGHGAGVVWAEVITLKPEKK